MTNAAPWLPYCGVAPTPAEWTARWNGDPILIALLLLAGVAISVARIGRHERRLALASLVIAALLFVSPFCALTSALFAARSAHHVALTALLAPLLAWSVSSARLPQLPGALAGWAATSAATLWLWHIPALYAAALSADGIYWAMQLSLIVTAAGFWASIRRASEPQAIAALLGYMVQMGLLGALLTFSSTSFYAPHALTTQAWGLSPLEDQQLGGLIMWVPGSLVYLAAALLLLHRLIGQPRAMARA